MRFAYASCSDFTRSKIKSSSELELYITELRQKERAPAPSIATLNGSFDILHSGHLHIIYEAARSADILIVALNTDASIKRYKHASRPIIPLKDRMEMVASLSYVDFVTWFEEENPCTLIQLLRPNIHINGQEYGINCVEAATVCSIGATLKLIERIPRLATSDIIQKIRNLPDTE